MDFSERDHCCIIVDWRKHISSMLCWPMIRPCIILLYAWEYKCGAQPIPSGRRINTVRRGAGAMAMSLGFFSLSVVVRIHLHLAEAVVGFGNPRGSPARVNTYMYTDGRLVLWLWLRLRVAGFFGAGVGVGVGGIEALDRDQRARGAGGGGLGCGDVYCSVFCWFPFLPPYPKKKCHGVTECNLIKVNPLRIFIRLTLQ